ncbi:bifunctional DNA primase/polymerase [Kitasatospora sp. NPDC007106]|uniref:bifunctional DNA primase/polymerase n=1 Tax=Kitasatospora sp. NPDC007106 TaxID=3156914 RepID=UPI0033E2C3D4
MTDLLRAVLGYADHGWKVFPLSGKTPAIPRLHPKDDPCRGECGSDGHGYHDATTDQDHLRAWWDRYPQANIGLPCLPNGLAVVDIDPRNGGNKTLAHLEGKLGPLPGTLMQITGGDGLHMVYRAPQQRLPGKLGPGIDVKANGYIVVAPSVHPDTAGRYRWSGDGKFTHRPAPWPAVLLPRQQAPVVPRQPVRPGGERDTLAGLVHFVLEAQEGERNSRLYWAACRALEVTREGRVSAAAVFAALVDAGVHIGLSEAEAARTVRSADRAPARGAVSA